MTLLALLALVSSVALFVLAMFNTAIDPNRTLDMNGEPRSLTETEKRRRFMWFALAAMPCIAFSLAYLLRGY